MEDMFQPAPPELLAKMRESLDRLQSTNIHVESNASACLRALDDERCKLMHLLVVAYIINGGVFLKSPQPTVTVSYPASSSSSCPAIENDRQIDLDLEEELQRFASSLGSIDLSADDDSDNTK